MVRRNASGLKVQSLEQTVNQDMLRWFGRNVSMLTERMPRCALYILYILYYYGRQVTIGKWFPMAN